MQFSLYGPLHGVTGYDTVVRAFIKEWYYQGHTMAAAEFEKWSNLKMMSDIDQILHEVKTMPAFEPEFHINFCLLEQAKLNLNAPNIIYTMFESNKIPEMWVRESSKLDLVVVPTEFNRKSFVDSGIPESKVAVCPCPLDIQKIKSAGTLNIKTHTGEEYMKYKHRFLNVSEFIQRKNVEQLIQCWLDETKETDDACLLLKLNSNSGFRLDFLKAKIDTWVANKKSAPIFIYTDFLSEASMLSLYNSCTHYITTSYGEGWGLGESTCGVLGKRVIAPQSSAFTEYLNVDNSYPVMCQKIRAMQDGPTAFYYAGSDWWGPLVYSVRRVIRKSINEANEGENKKGALLSKQLIEKCDSFRVANRLLNQIKNITPKRGKVLVPVNKEQLNYNFLMVCKSLGTPCGIADHSFNLFKSTNTEENKKLYSGNLLIRGEPVEYNAILEGNDLHVLNLQLEYQFASPARLELLLKYCNNSDIIPTITMHTVNPQAYSYHDVMANNRCNIIVSSGKMKRLLYDRCGIKDEHDHKVVKVIPMGMTKDNITSFKTRDDGKFRIGFFGFCYFHKGIDKLIDYMSQASGDKQCLILSSKPTNDRGYFEKMNSFSKKVNKGNISWIPDYLEEAQIVDALSSCDLIFLPYSEYGGVGVSAAVRTCLKAGVPIVGFDNSFFRDVVHDSKLIEFVGSNPDDYCQWSTNLEGYIANMQKDLQAFKTAYVEKRDQFVNDYSYDNVAKMHLEYFRELVLEKLDKEAAKKKVAEDLAEATAKMGY